VEVPGSVEEELQPKSASTRNSERRNMRRRSILARAAASMRLGDAGGRPRHRKRS
jgi:hypothetical protein